MNKYTDIAGIIGNPAFYGEGFRDYSPETMQKMREYGFNTVFVNIAWSRPHIDAVIPEHVMVSERFPLISPPDAYFSLNAISVAPFSYLVMVMWFSGRIVPE